MRRQESQGGPDANPSLKRKGIARHNIVQKSTANRGGGGNRLLLDVALGATELRSWMRHSSNGQASLSARLIARTKWAFVQARCPLGTLIAHIKICLSPSGAPAHFIAIMPARNPAYLPVHSDIFQVHRPASGWRWKSPPYQGMSYNYLPVFLL